jgi:ABC-type multidrug transport system ATPase subunit
VIIIHAGRVAASGTLAELGAQAGENQTVVVEGEGAIDWTPLSPSPDVCEVEAETVNGASRARITTNDAPALARRICLLAARHGWRLTDIRPQRRTLEDLFIRITGDEPAAVRR